MWKEKKTNIFIFRFKKRTQQTEEEEQKETVANLNRYYEA